MLYFINENVEIDLSKVSVLENKKDFLSGERNLYARVDGKEYKVDNVFEFMKTYTEFKKQEGLGKQYTAS